MTFSIVIPTYEMHGKGVSFLDYNIRHILSQKFSDYEIIISDHSKDFAIQQYIDKLNCGKIKYVRYMQNYGKSAANLNNAIKYATGEIIKPMFQDDYFYDDNALYTIFKQFQASVKWVVCGSNKSVNHKDYCNVIIPQWTDDILYGNNKLSSPSCVAYIKDCDVQWDNRLVWLVDCEFYWRMFLKHGRPFLLKYTLVTNFAHENQLTNLLSEKAKAKELKLIKKEYAKQI